MIGAIFTGAIIGAIAGKMMDAKNGLIMNIIIGILGANLGHFIFGLVGFSARGLAGVFVEIIGACLVIAIARKIA